VKTVREITEAAADLGVKYMTLYTFSTENWNRPAFEVNALMTLLIDTVRSEIATLMKNNIRLKAIGEIEKLPSATYKALLEGIAEIPEIDPSVRAQATSDFDAMGKDAFAERLKAVDPEFFTRLAVYDRQRLLRAYEVWLGTGKSLSWWQKKGSTPPYPREDITIYRVDIDRELLYQRCNQRFDVMLEQGAIEEVKQLFSLNISDTMPIMKSVGVKELRAYIMGGMPLMQATDLAKQFTRNYAKRQLTWLRNQLPDAVPISSASEP
jgi:tRNA dimethylallyltransferase